MMSASERRLLYERLYLIRRVEEEIARVYPTDKITSPIHLSIGQELASVAVCSALEPEDKVFGSYRSHALYLAKGGDLKAFVAELFGKVTGCARGKGGSMHMVEPEAGLLGTSAIVGSLIPVATGFAFAQKLKGSPIVTACFFGDGATEEGAFFESMNFAAVKKLPILYVCENNDFAIHTPIAQRQSTSIYGRAEAFGLTVGLASATDTIINMARALVRRVRHGDGPALLEVKSPRLKEHVGPGEDWDKGYRKPPTEEEYSDPLCQALIDERIGDIAKSRIEKEIAEAFAFAEISSEPPADELMKDLYG